MRMIKTRVDSVSMNSLTSCLTHVTPPIQVHRLVFISTKQIKIDRQAMNYCLCIYLVPRGDFGLHHRSLPAEHYGSESRAGPAGCPATAARPGLSGPSREQRDFPLRHEGVDHTVQPGQVRQQTDTDGDYSGCQD